VQLEVLLAKTNTIQRHIFVLHPKTIPGHLYQPHSMAENQMAALGSTISCSDSSHLGSWVHQNFNLKHPASLHLAYVEPAKTINQG